MSRGRGRIENEIIVIFSQNPERIWSTCDLCRHIYQVDVVEKKHRVAVLRALKSAAGKALPHLKRNAPSERADDVWFDGRWHGKKRQVAYATQPRPSKRPRS